MSEHCSRCASLLKRPRVAARRSSDKRNGPIGLLALAALAEDDRFGRLYCLGRRDRPDPAIDVVEGLEATGYVRHAFECISALAPNGVAALLGIPEDWTFEIEGGRFHRDCVLENKALVGSVNSNRRHFAAAKERLEAVPGWVVDDLISEVYPPEGADRAFDEGQSAIKTAIEFDTP